MFKELKYKHKYENFTKEDLYGLDNHLTKLILPRLKEFRKLTIGHPGNLDSIEEWNAIIDKIILAFEYLQNYDDLVMDNSDGRTTQERVCYYDRKIKKGLKLFAKYYTSLWI